MLVEIFLFLFSIAFVFFVMMFLRDTAKPFYAVISFALFLFLAINSFDIDLTYCSLTTSNAWSCNTNTFNEPSVAVLNGGMGLVSLVYLVIFSFIQKGKGE